jgi:hypothetical protein
MRAPRLRNDIAIAVWVEAFAREVPELVRAAVYDESINIPQIKRDTIHAMSETPEFLNRQEAEEAIEALGLKCRICGEDIKTPEDMETYRENTLCNRCSWKSGQD